MAAKQNNLKNLIAFYLLMMIPPPPPHILAASVICILTLGFEYATL